MLAALHLGARATLESSPTPFVHSSLFLSPTPTLPLSFSSPISSTLQHTLIRSHLTLALAPLALLVFRLQS